MKLFQRLFQPKQLAVGSPAPHFSLPSQSGGVVDSADHIGKKVVVLYFYPKDNTYNCIAESCDFRDHYEVFKEAGAEVIGISSDSPSSHADFAGKYKLPFLLLSDEQNIVRRRYRVPPTFGVIPGRVTFVIDQKGIIRHLFSSQFNPKSHVEQALRVLRELTP